MKKVLAFITALMCIALCGCGNTENAEVSETEHITTTEVSVYTTMPIDLLEENEQSETAEEIEEQAEAVSDAKYIDYAYIENYIGTKDIGDLADKAVEYFTTTDIYKETVKYSSMYYDDYDEYFSEDSGELRPVFNEAFTEDFDGDGKNEYFIILDMPYQYNEEDKPFLWNFLVYADSNENMTYLDQFSNMYTPQLLDYGSFKQVILGGYGRFGAEDHRGLWGVKDGSANELYFFRGSFFKQDCFLTTYGWMGSGDLMLYNTESGEYDYVCGKEIPIGDILEMDKDKNIKYIYDIDNTEQVSATLIGNKYYCICMGIMDPGDIYTYENGSFAPADVELRYEYLGEESENNFITDFDYDTVVSEMKHVEPNYPKIDIEQLPTERAEQIKADYAEYAADKFGSLTADDIEIRNYLGSYAGYDYLVLYPKNAVITYDIKVISLGDTDLSLPSGSLDILVYSEYGFWDHDEAKFIDIETAYADDYLGQNAAKQIKYTLENN